MNRAVTVSVGTRRIGPGEPVFIVAEIGASHRGDPDVAARLIEQAAQCGVDAVKLQTIDAEESYVPGTPSYEIFKELWLSPEALRRLMRVAADCGVVLFTTPGDPGGLQALLEVGMPLIKISSGLLTNLPLVERAAKTGLPLIISTGMSYLDEVTATVRAAEEVGCRQLALMHCTALYPSPAETLNLAAMETMASTFVYPVGYSDHYDGTTASLAAAALGARLLEKHFTLDRAGGGPDDHFAADPAQLAALVRDVRAVEQMLGSSEKAPAPAEVPGRNVYRRCLVARRSIAAGEMIRPEAIGLKRPRAGRQGLPPASLSHVIGRRAACDIALHESLTLEMLAPVEHATA